MLNVFSAISYRMLILILEMPVRSVNEEFQLKYYSTLPEVLNAINKISFRDGMANTYTTCNA
ncbi:hypothetical protein KUTeg_023455 [Tegillarca granosa]|uniref:Uncharacterized protein n=1 Tax=Tegillarca granosa TaxID=220873 RepID=A0ABQ9E7D2_TEGGR|nr:hypothetical protein KUTeg_023455 [Tegillarca granosa]